MAIPGSGIPGLRERRDRLLIPGRRAAILLLATAMIEAAGGAPACGAPVTATDFRGKAICLPAPAERIVCLIESALSGLFMLGEARRVVGISANVYRGETFAYYAALDDRIRLRTLPAPGNWDFVNIEAVLALRPDLVIIWASQTEAITALEERGVSVFGVFITRLEEVYREITAFGELTGNRNRAQTLIAAARGEIDSFRGLTPDLPAEKRPAVYFMWAQSALETSCGTSTVQDLIELAGGRNVCAALAAEHAVVNLERLIGWNPEVIVMWPNERLDPMDIIGDERFRMIAAVRGRRVHELPEAFLCDLWTLKFPYAVRLVHSFLYPAASAGVSLEQEKRRMLRELYGREIP